MKASRKIRITITVDQDIGGLLERMGNERSIKTSSYINRILRRHFQRPGKNMEQYCLRKGLR